MFKKHVLQYAGACVCGAMFIHAAVFNSSETRHLRRLPRRVNWLTDELFLHWKNNKKKKTRLILPEKHKQAIFVVIKWEGKKKREVKTFTFCQHFDWVQP